jgi:hypothetical protein
VYKHMYIYTASLEAAAPTVFMVWLWPGFNFVLPLNAFATVQCAEVGIEGLNYV